MSRYYRDLQPGETLQVGDMWRLANDSDAEWQTITADDIAEAPEGGLTVTSVEESGIEYRRPVDLQVLQRAQRYELVSRVIGATVVESSSGDYVEITDVRAAIDILQEGQQ